jgi:hypothetical protein
LFFLYAIAPPAEAQTFNFDKPLQTIDEEVTSFSFAPDGRLVYGVRRLIKTKQFDLEHDDIWLQENGKRRRILIGEKLLRGETQVTYAIDSLRWSPNAHLILAELFASTVDKETGRGLDSAMTLVAEDSGKDIRINGREPVIENARSPMFLQDNATIVYLTEVMRPNILFSFKALNVANGPLGSAFEGRTFLAAVQVPRTNMAIAVERDRNLSGPPRLQRLDMLSQEDKELATLEDYEGGLTLSPSGKKIAYYLDKEVLEIRDLTAPDHIARIRIGLGDVQWMLDEKRILLRRAIEKRSGDVAVIDLPPLAAYPADKTPPVSQPTPVPLFHGVTFREFGVSPDGRFIGVVVPGKRSLLIFPFSGF